MNARVNLSGLSTEEPDVQYPMNLKCQHCGFTFGDHQKTGAWCPSGPRDRTVGFTRYSDEYFFSPVMPHLPAKINHAIFAFTDQLSVVIHLANSKSHEPKLLKRHERVAMKYKYSLFGLLRALIDENRELKKQLKMVQEEAQCKKLP
jgi:hypothetical protein